MSSTGSHDQFSSFGDMIACIETESESCQMLYVDRIYQVLVATTDYPVMGMVRVAWPVFFKFCPNILPS